MDLSINGGATNGTGGGRGGGGGDRSGAKKLMCPICGEAAFRDHLNYGAISCYSCRAFFRRIHKDKADPPKLICKGVLNLGQCDITLETRRKCKKCRYDRCIKAGMQPKAVLKEGQRQTRFKNSFYKKGEPQSEPPSTSMGWRPSTSVTVVTLHTPESVLHHLCRAKKHPFSFCGCVQFQDLMTSTTRAQLNKVALIKQKRLKSIHHSWNTALRHFSCRRDFLANFVQMQTPGSDEVLDDQLFGQFAADLKELFESFAAGLDHFSCLTQEDKTMVLRRNSGLFLLYMLSRVFCSPRPLDQLAWLTLRPEKLADAPGLVPAALAQCHLVTNGERFHDLCKAVVDLSPSFECTPLVAALILFNAGPLTPGQTDININVDSQFFSVYNLLCPQCPGCLSQENALPFLSALDELYSFFQSNSLTSWQHQHLTDPLVAKYNCSEEIWFRHQTDRLDRAYNRLPLGEDLVNEIMFYSLGEPLSAKFAPELSTISIERVRLMFTMHSEVEQLKHAEYQHLWQECLPQALAVLWCKTEITPSIQDQISYLSGLPDNKLLLEDNYQQILQKKNLKPMRFMDWHTITSNPFTKEQKDDIIAIWKNLTPHLEKDTFKLFILVAMFSVPAANNYPAITRLKLKYSTLLARKTAGEAAAAAEQSEANVSSGSGETAQEKLLHSLSQVKRLAGYAQILLMSYQLKP